MRFWITKNGEVPVHEQLVRQVVLGILSEDLPAGRKLPSVRALARRHHIHSNTVSAAYHDLLQQGWLELRRGSGLYVRTPASSPDGPGELNRLLTAVLQSAQSLGYQPDEVLRSLTRMVQPHSYERVLVIEAESAMREILQAEIGEQIGPRAHALAAHDFRDASGAARTLVVALPTRAAQVRRTLPQGVPCIALRPRSVRQLLEGQSRPAPGVVVAIVSRSPEIRQWARAMLIAVGLEPESLCEIDASASSWKERVGRGAFVVADIVAARELPAGCPAHTFRVIADSALAELKQFCPGSSPC
jgi:GntR family transcriptional regulator